MNRQQVLEYLKSKKRFLAEQYGITTIGIYGSYAKDKATVSSDIDIFYDTNKSFSMGFLALAQFIRDLEKDLSVHHIDFVKLSTMNPIIRHYAEKDFIYV